MAKKTENTKAAESVKADGAPSRKQSQASTDGYSAETNWVVTKPDGGKINVRAFDGNDAIIKVQGQ